MATKQESYTCDICTAPMQFTQRLTNMKGKKGNVFRRRRFKCTVCDFEKTIYADGHHDENIYPTAGISQIRKIEREATESELRLRNNPLSE